MGSFFFIIILSFISGFFDGLGTGLIIPLMDYIQRNGNIDGASATSYVWKYVSFFFQFLCIPITFVNLLIIISLVIVIKQVISFLVNKYNFSYRETLSRNLRKRCMEGVLYSPFSRFHGSRAGNQVDTISQETYDATGVVVILIDSVKLGITALIYLVLLFYIAFKLTAFSILILFLSLVIVRMFTKRSKEAGYLNVELNQKFKSSLYEIISGIKVIKSLNKEDFELRRSEEIINGLAKVKYTQKILTRLSAITIEPFLSIFILLAIFVAVEKLRLPLSYLVAYMYILVRLLPFYVEFNVKRNEFAAAIGCVSCVLDFLETFKRAEPRSGGTRIIKDIREGVSLKGVSFSFDGKIDVLKNITCTFEANKTTAVVGPSGAGKSTLVELLLGFYSIKSGEITFDGVLISDIDIRSLRKIISYVPQEPFLFNDTIMNNIGYGLEQFDRDGIIEAAKKAHAHEFISRFSEGYEKNVGERGSTLSGGERQRIALARALVRKPRMLILDEATSALDSESEAMIQDALSELHGKCTIIVIAHRLSTVKTADKIFVMNEGEFIEVGTHRELIAQRGEYAKYCSLQTMWDADERICRENRTQMCNDLEK